MSTALSSTSDEKIRDPIYGLFLSQLNEKEKEKIKKEIPDINELVEDPSEVKRQGDPELPYKTVLTYQLLGAFLGGLVGGAGFLTAAPIKPGPYSKDDPTPILILYGLLGSSGLGAFLGRDAALWLLNRLYGGPTKKVEVGKDEKGKPVYIEVREGQSIFKLMRRFLD